MEFPELGKHCSESSCKQLDFLPVRCDACKNIYCKDHFMYQTHNCPDAYKKDNQVPECPLCNKPIPVGKGQSADIVVGQHIDADCQSDPAKEKRGKIYSNKCSKKGCKTKELVPFVCEGCHLNYCIKHRLETDHSCKGFQNTGRHVSKAGAAAVSRLSNLNNAPGAAKSPSKPPMHRPHQTNNLSSIGGDLDRERRERQRAMQGGLSEDEAMARALAASMQEPSSEPTTDKQRQEEADAALARALQMSEQESRNQRSRGETNRQQSRSDKSNCSLS